MRDRVIGIENEYGVIRSETNTPSSGAVDENCLESVLAKGGQYGQYDATCNPRRLWLQNGGCLYVDLKKLEWASPECRRIRDVVAYNKAAESLITDLMRGNDGSDLFHFFKMNVARHEKNESGGSEFATFGCHENYMTYNLPEPSHSMIGYVPLVPFLVTRQVYGGSGWWPHGKEDQFHRSQRASFIEQEAGGNTTSARPILNGRNESHTTMKGLGRLHLIMGDANMLEYGLFLKVGATMLMVSLLEEGLLPKHFIRPNTPPQFGRDNSVRALHTISRMADPREKTLILSGPERQWRFLSPIEVQAYYCELATKYVKSTTFPSEEAEHEALLTCAMWQETLEALSRDDASFLEGRIDWYTKRRLVARDLRKNERQAEPQSPESIRAQIDMLYHYVADDSLYQRLKKNGIAKRVLSDEEIARAINEPPPDTMERGTRATVRGQAILEALLEREAPERKKYLKPGWDKLAFELELTGTDSHGVFYSGSHPGYAPSETFSMNDPLECDLKRWNEFCKNIKPSGSLACDDFDYGYAG